MKHHSFCLVDTEKRQEMLILDDIEVRGQISSALANIQEPVQGKDVEKTGVKVS